METNFPICPNCKNVTFGALDEWGYTPIHLHCNNCGINIGATSLKKCFELFQLYNKPHTFLEYYHNDIQLLFENNKKIINKEKKIK